MNEIIIYTDGSCHTDYRTGAWAAIILHNSKEIELSGVVNDTTHNRMELYAVISAFEYILKHSKPTELINVYTDSQYVAGIESRKEKLRLSDFKTKAGNYIQNVDLVKNLIEYTEVLQAKFIKVKAHQKKTKERNINREVDKLSRKLVREEVKKSIKE